jgi:hypothetical protein
MRPAFLLIILSLVLTPSSASTQVTPAPSPGDRVRVSVHEDGRSRTVGTLISLNPGNLVLLVRSDTVTFTTASVYRLEIAQGRERGNTILSRMGIGLLAGLAAGAGAAFVQCSMGTCDDPAMVAVFAPLWLGSGGAVLGALWGAVAPAQRWKQISLPQP